MKKPLIETLINTSAVTLTGWGAQYIVNCCDGSRPPYWGFLMISFGAGLEWFKYWGRSKRLW